MSRPDLIESVIGNSTEHIEVYLVLNSESELGDSTSETFKSPEISLSMNQGLKFLFSPYSFLIQSDSHRIWREMNEWYSVIKITQDITCPCTAVVDVFCSNQIVQAHVTLETPGNSLRIFQGILITELTVLFVSHTVGLKLRQKTCNNLAWQIAEI